MQIHSRKMNVDTEGTEHLAYLLDTACGMAVLM